MDVDTALDEFWQDQITFPPFSPNRVLEERHFFKVGTSDYFESLPERFVHPPTPSHSNKNLHRWVADFSQSGFSKSLYRRVADSSQSGLFVWFNSKTQETCRGSLMVYGVNNREVKTWFASFERTDTWKLGQVKGIAREQVEALMEPNIA